MSRARSRHRIFLKISSWRIFPRGQVMSDKSNYPYWRVIIGFTLCPAVVALLIVGAMMFFAIVHGEELGGGGDIWGGLLAILFISLLTSLYGFGVPAFLLSLLYVSIKLRKSFYAYLLTFVAGGSGAQVWASLPATGLGDGLFAFPGAFVMGAISSLAMAFIALPSRLEDNLSTG